MDDSCYTIDVTVASMVELPEPDDAFYDTIPNGGYGWYIFFYLFIYLFIQQTE